MRHTLILHIARKLIIVYILIFTAIDRHTHLCDTDKRYISSIPESSLQPLFSNQPPCIFPLSCFRCLPLGIKLLSFFFACPLVDICFHIFFFFFFFNSCLSRWAGLKHGYFLEAPLVILMCGQQSDPLPLDQTFCKLEAQIRDRRFSRRLSTALVKMFMSALRWVPLFFYLTFHGGVQQSYICVGGNPNLFDHTSSVGGKIGSDPHGTL